MNKKRLLIKGEYSVEMPCYYGKKVIWEILDDHFVKKGKERDEILIWGGVVFIFFMKTRVGG